MSDGVRTATPAMPALGGIVADDLASWMPEAVGRLGWRDARRAAALAVSERPSLVAVGLLGFLARGGLVLFLVPIVVLPTPTGISNFIGGTALTGAGASDSLIRLVAVAIGLVLTMILVGTVVGAVADVLLLRYAEGVRIARVRGIVTSAGLDAVDREAALRFPMRGRQVLAMTAVRLVALVPAAIASAWAASRLVAAAYHQLILPDDVAVPLGLRVLHEAADAAAVVVIAWLFGEFAGGLAVRQLAARGGWALASFGRATADVVRRPVTSLATFVLPTLGLALVATPVLVGAAVLWNLLQALLADDAPVTLLLPVTFLFVAVWAGGLLCVGLIVAWRSLLAGLDTLRALPSSRPAA